MTELNAERRDRPARRLVSLLTIDCVSALSKIAFTVYQILLKGKKCPQREDWPFYRRKIHTVRPCVFVCFS